MTISNCIIDVGAFRTGINTKKYRKNKNMNLPIIFLEPDLSTFNILKIEKHDIKLPLAINKYNGITKFNIYQTGTHSILNSNLEEIHKYTDGYSGKPGSKKLWSAQDIIYVPCIRLDTLMNNMCIEKIEFLKIDAQGFDLEVIKSLSDRIKDVKELVCEVQITDFEVYLNSSKKQEVINYMTKHNFINTHCKQQTFNQEENLYFKNKNYN